MLTLEAPSMEGWALCWVFSNNMLVRMFPADENCNHHPTGRKEGRAWKITSGSLLCSFIHSPHIDRVAGVSVIAFPETGSSSLSETSLILVLWTQQKAEIPGTLSFGCVCKKSVVLCFLSIYVAFSSLLLPFFLSPSPLCLCLNVCQSLLLSLSYARA